MILQPSESSVIKVVARCRPFTADEKSQGGKNVVKLNGDRVSLELNGKVCFISRNVYDIILF